MKTGWFSVAPIDKYVYVIVKERFDDKIYINYSIKEIVNDVSEIQHQLVREAMKKVGVERGVEITTLADVPSEGSGLGSSSTVTVGSIKCLVQLCRHAGYIGTNCREACEIEIDICKKTDRQAGPVHCSLWRFKKNNLSS